jgi:hypothetical protein
MIHKKLPLQNRAPGKNGLRGDILKKIFNFAIEIKVYFFDR